MNWQVGYDVSIYNLAEADAAIWAKVLIEGIEQGMNHLEYLQACGKYCEGCGDWRICHTADFNDEAPTDRGTEFRLMTYQLCDECDPS